MIIFLAGLQGVPQELYEAAEIDGASALAALPARHAADDLADDLLQPRPRRHRRAPGLRARVRRDQRRAGLRDLVLRAAHLQAGLQYFEMGYASALAWIFFVIVLVLTCVQFRLAQRWVYYAGENE